MAALPTTDDVGCQRGERTHDEDWERRGRVLGLGGVDFDDSQQREAFYDGLLTDPRMQEVIDPATDEPARRNLTPSCETNHGVAYPPRRIVSVAKAFGPDSVVQSICESDFAPAIDAIAERIAHKLGD